ncbi:MAG: hypothetical protein OH344_03450 [Candidatus Parvarchaeota archaeon]|nr:hypothetical protein [Candidatus Jingweiarchaeum tengchongense]
MFGIKAFTYFLAFVIGFVILIYVILFFTFAMQLKKVPLNVT